MPGQGQYSAADVAPAQTSGQYSAADVDTGPPPEMKAAPEAHETSAWDIVPAVGAVHMLSDAADKLHEWASMTQEGKQQHPVQAAVGQMADRIKQLLVGGQGGGSPAAPPHR